MFVKKDRDYDLFCFVGPSGSGKNYLAYQVIKSNLADMIVSATTRDIRKGEIPNVDYYFISKDQFNEHIKNGDFFEHVEYSSASYGFFNSELDKLKKTPCIAIVTPDGAKQLAEHVKNIKLIYIKTDPEKRLSKTRERYGDDIKKYEDEINKRIEEDERVFGDFSRREDVIVFENDYTVESETEIQKMIFNIMFNLEANSTVDRDVISAPINEIKKQEAR
ncbi:MAG: hypothetical protein ACRCVH_13585 [Vagococcus fluvialis]